MKIFYSFLILLLPAFFSNRLNAQMFAGGNLGFNNSSSKSYTGTTLGTKSVSNSISLSPLAGKYLSPKTAAGLSLAFSYSISKTGVNTITTNSSTSF